MGGLREHTPTLQQKAELPSSPTQLTLRLIDDDRIQQPTPPDLLDERGIECANPRAELLPEHLCAFRQTFVDQDIESNGGNGTSQWVSASSLDSQKTKWVDQKSFLPSVCTSVFSGFYAEHDVLIGQYGRHRVH